VWEKYDREELYQKVWEQPLVKVAEGYGVSAVGCPPTSDFIVLHYCCNVQLYYANGLI
jgi:hypothetical protein